MHPKILYISEVPVELSYAGATLVYRLLEQYPPDNLLIIQTGHSITRRRLKDVEYLEVDQKTVLLLKRLRLPSMANALDVLSRQRLSGRLRKKIELFRPDAVISVTFNLSWLTAYEVSNRYNIPLILLLHDDFLTTEKFGLMQAHLVKKFREVYTYAHTCFNISPEMEAHYRRAYGKKGEVLYPFRGKNDSVYRIDWQNAPDKKSLKFCYAGSIGTTDFLPLMNDLAEILERHGHTLSLFVNVPKEMVHQYPHLTKPHVSFSEMVHPDLLKKYISEQVDVNILLNSFQHEDLFKLNFSSKIVDYTAVDIPVFFWGAATSGILSWAIRGNYPCIVTQPDSRLAEAEIVKLRDLSYRKKLAAQLHAMAEDTFGFWKNYDTFIARLNSPAGLKQIHVV